MPLINFPIDLSRTAAALEGIHAQLASVARALERLSPAPPSLDNRKPYVAGLGDLRYTDVPTVQNIREELKVYAEEHALQMDSERFLDSIIKYERDIMDTYGPNAILELPWNKAAGGSLFGQTQENSTRQGNTYQGQGSEAAHQQQASQRANRESEASTKP